MRTRWFVAVGLVVALVGTIGSRTSQAQTAEPDEALVRAVDTIRLINTAEMRLRLAGEKYAQLGELPLVNACKETAKKFPEQFGTIVDKVNLQNPKEFLNGFNVSMIVSPDGRSYKISVEEKADCGTAFFSDDRGLIYRGKTIGCAK